MPSNNVKGKGKQSTRITTILDHQGVPTGLTPTPSSAQHARLYHRLY
jgi:hypothetical protein